MKKLLQQGDVLIKEIDSIPSDVKRVEPGQFGHVLAYGEVTGHKHKLEDVENVEMFEKGGKSYIRVKKPSLLTHEEHKFIMIPPGNFEIGIVREYDHFAEEAGAIED